MFLPPVTAQEHNRSDASDDIREDPGHFVGSEPRARRPLCSLVCPVSLAFLFWVLGADPHALAAPRASHLHGQPESPAVACAGAAGKGQRVTDQGTWELNTVRLDRAGCQ